MGDIIIPKEIIDIVNKVQHIVDYDLPSEQNITAEDWLLNEFDDYCENIKMHKPFYNKDGIRIHEVDIIGCVIFKNDVPFILIPIYELLTSKVKNDLLILNGHEQLITYNLKTNKYEIENTR